MCKVQLKGADTECNGNLVQNTLQISTLSACSTTYDGYQKTENLNFFVRKRVDAVTFSMGSYDEVVLRFP